MIPKALEGMEIRPSFFNLQPVMKGKIKIGEKWTISKDFATAVIAHQGLMIDFITSMTVALGSGGAIVVVKAIVKDKDGKTIGTGVASASNVEGDNRYAANGQKAATYSVKNALKWMYGITDDVIDEMAKSIGLEHGKNTGKNPMSTPEPVLEAPPEELPDESAEDLF